MLGLRIDVAKQIDSVSHSLVSFADAVQRTLRNESWYSGEPRIALIKEKKSTALSERSTSGGIKRSSERRSSASGAADNAKTNLGVVVAIIGLVITPTEEP